MDFWIFMLIMALLIPTSMIVIGAIYVKRPPKNINIIYGYRTTRSMKSQEAWEFANRLIGKYWLIIGLIMIVPFGLSMLFVLNKSDDIIGIFGAILLLVEIIPLEIPIFFVEKALKKNFDENGNKINPMD